MASAVLRTALAAVQLCTASAVVQLCAASAVLQLHLRIASAVAHSCKSVLLPASQLSLRGQYSSTLSYAASGDLFRSVQATTFLQVVLSHHTPLEAPEAVYAAQCAFALQLREKVLLGPWC